MTPLRDIEQGIDRKALKALRARFLNINHERLERAKAVLTPRQQSALNLLPLLLALNHPLLPGYISANTPAGFNAYSPTAEALLAAKKIARAFSYKAPVAELHAPLQGLFLMGSLGSLAHAEHSDMDLWLCYDPALGEQELSELTRKCRALEHWAAGQGCELHFFLINPEQFRQGTPAAELGDDHCGSSQHYLLLDEFYRTAIWLAGRTLLWWLVPSEHEADYRAYSQALISRRFIQDEEVLDLGYLAQIPVSEYLSAGLWQLLKGLQSPYKSVLKLLVIEAYARQHPTAPCLALSYKSAIQHNQLNLNDLDPYVMVYRLLEQMLLRQGDTQRLELVRRCLYLKVHKKLTQAGSTPKSWQRLLLEQLIHEWGWSHEQLLHLDSHSKWRAPAVMREQSALVSEMLYSYRFLATFAVAHDSQQHLTQRDLKLLGRKLYAAFEHKAGKIERINPGIASDLTEALLCFEYVAENATHGPYWALAADATSNQPLVIKKAQSLIELIAWAFFNGLYRSDTQLKIKGVKDFAEPVLYRLFEMLRNSALVRSKAISDEAFLQASSLTHTALIINLGLDPLANQAHLPSEQSDVLCYSQQRRNLVLGIDQISINSWQECYTQHFSGPKGLLDMLCALFNDIKNPLLPTLEVRCYARNRAQAISQRVQELVSSLLELYQKNEPCRYLIQLAEPFYVLHLSHGEVSYLELPDRAALLKYLAHTPAQAPSLKLDPYVLRQDSLRLILEKAQAGTVQVFYQLIDANAQLSILDEHNSLWRQVQPFYDTSSLLRPVERFLRAVIFRLNTQHPLAKEPELNLAFYEITGPRSALRLETRNPNAYTLRAGFYSVQAVLEPGKPVPLLSIYCNQQRFCALDYPNEIYPVVARYILAHRRSAEKYRCYLTDLDISRLAGENHTTAAYLHYKSQIEYALNQALSQL